MDATIAITTREAAAAHRVSLRTAQRWAAKGKLNATKTGGRWAIAITADLDGYKPAQLERARELIEASAILPTSRPGLYTAVSSDGTTTYLVAAQTCSCPAARHGRACYHRAAVAILQAAATARHAA